MSQTRTPPVLDIIIVTARGSRDYLGACLRSLEDAPLTMGESRVWVVDNHSGEDVGSVVRGRPGVTLLPQAQNLGFARANNVGLAHASGALVLFLNPDTEVHPGALDACAQRILGDKRIGIVGCRLLDRRGVSDPNARRTFPSLRAAVHRLSGWDRVAGPSAYHTPAMTDDGQGPVDAVSGSFMMARRSLVTQLGGFDAGYWMYGEDLDLCRRVHDTGYLSWYEGSVSILHVGGGSAGKIRRARATIAFHHAMVRYYRKYEAGPRGWLNGLVYSGIWLRAAVVLVVNRLRQASRWILGGAGD